MKNASTTFFVFILVSFTFILAACDESAFVEEFDIHEESSDTAMDHVDAMMDSSEIIQGDFFELLDMLGEARLSLSISPDDPEPTIHVPGDAINFPLRLFRLAAVDADVRLTSLTVGNFDIVTLRLSGEADKDRVAEVWVYDENLNLVGANTDGFDESGFARVEFTEEFVIPADDYRELLVIAILHPIEDETTTGGTLNVSAIHLEAVHAQTGQPLSEEMIMFAHQPLDRINMIRRTKPTLVVPSMSNGTFADFGLSNGPNTLLFRFEVQANPVDDLSWLAVTFEFTGNVNYRPLTHVREGVIGTSEIGVISDFVLYDATTGVQLASDDGSITFGSSISGGIYATVVLPQEQIIESGVVKTYELRATISGIQTDGDLICVKLANYARHSQDIAIYLTESSDLVDGVEDGMVTSGYSGVLPYAFLWSDNSSLQHSSTSRDWTNEKLVEVGRECWNHIPQF